MALKITMRSQPTAATYREKLEIHRPQLAEQRARVAELRIAQDAAAEDRPTYDRIGREIVAAEGEARRLETVVAACEDALPAAEEAERRAGILAERDRLMREQVRTAARWAREYEEAGSTIAGILRAMEEDDLAVKRLNDELRSIGEQPVSNTRHRHLREANGKGVWLPWEVQLPKFADANARHWPPPRKIF